MHRHPIIFFLTLTCYSLSYLCAEDALELRDGRLLRGTYVGGTQGTLRMETGAGIEVIALADVVALTIGTRPSPSPTPAVPPVAVTSKEPVAPVGKGTAPIGTSLLVRTKDTIDSRKQGTGTRFTAILEGDLVIEGKTLGTRGSTIYGQINSSRPAGRLLGKSEMVLVLTGILIDGQVIPWVTSAAVLASEGQGKDTAKKVAAGALVGGAIDGKDGAGKGAMVGGAVALLGRGGSLQVASGSLLEFKLEQPFTR